MIPHLHPPALTCENVGHGAINFWFSSLTVVKCGVRWPQVGQKGAS
jgi:hypothetical protein